LTHSLEFNNLYFSAIIFRVLNIKIMKWAGQNILMVKLTNKRKYLVGSVSYVKKGKVPLWGRYSALQPYRLIVLLTPKGVPSFISRGAAQQAARASSASEGRDYRWNLANNLVIHLNC
jgi:hypothetical protein